MDRREFLTTATAVVPFLAGCTGGDGSGGGAESPTQTPSPTPTDAMGTPTPTGTPTPKQQADVTIVMKNTAFQTLKAEVDTGATVEWVNEDGFAHTVTSAQFHDVAKSWSFDEQVAAGGSVTHTFDAKGVYEYYCTIHGKGTMCGAVLVGGATLGKSLPCGSSDDGGYY